MPLTKAVSNAECSCLRGSVTLMPEFVCLQDACCYAVCGIKMHSHVVSYQLLHSAAGFTPVQDCHGRRYPQHTIIHACAVGQSSRVRACSNHFIGVLPCQVPVAALRGLQGRRARLRRGRWGQRCAGDGAQRLHSPPQALPGGGRGLRAAQSGLQEAQQGAGNLLRAFEGALSVCPARLE